MFLLADKVDNHFNSAKEPFKVLFLEDLPDQETIKNMCFYYTPFELCCALRGLLHEYMYKHEIAEFWLFLDSDILIFSSLDEIFQQLKSTSILLNPHILAPASKNHIELTEVPTLVSGLYNAGFLGLKATKETGEFIAWFKDRLTNYSFSRRGQGIYKYLFVDQLWLNFTPLFFKDVSYLIHPGANLAYWRLVTGTLSKQNNSYFFNDRRIIFIHYTGWDIRSPSKLSGYLEKDIDVWPELGAIYQELLFKCGYEECSKYPNTFSVFNNGKPVTPEMRFLYHEYLSSNESCEMNPFSDRGYRVLKQLQRRSRPSLIRDLKKIIKKMIDIEY